MNRTETAELTFAELAARTGLPGRTIRFYIAKGLLPGPTKAGRAAAYGPEHLQRLQRIRRLQDKGLTLAGERGEESLAPPTNWWQYSVQGDVMVWVRADASPWRLRQVRKFLNDMAAGLAKTEP